MHERGGERNWSQGDMSNVGHLNSAFLRRSLRLCDLRSSSEKFGANDNALYRLGTAASPRQRSGAMTIHRTPCLREVASPFSTLRGL